ncbi:MAG: hypothetical protein CM15mP59_5390 [Flavobacteriaceae bacterium]|nr:MAG: hypothetical protein CM15mP59_5390 [Flavobacteriaceae bacterium]
MRVFPIVYENFSVNYGSQMIEFFTLVEEKLCAYKNKYQITENNGNCSKSFSLGSKEITGEKIIVLNISLEANIFKKLFYHWHTIKK